MTNDNESSSRVDRAIAERDEYKAALGRIVMAKSLVGLSADEVASAVIESSSRVVPRTGITPRTDELARELSRYDNDAYKVIDLLRHGQTLERELAEVAEERDNLQRYYREERRVRLVASNHRDRLDGRRLMYLIASAWFSGNWKAETPNEREMQEVMERNGFWPIKEWAQITALAEATSKREQALQQLTDFDQEHGLCPSLESNERFQTFAGGRASGNASPLAQTLIGIDQGKPGGDKTVKVSGHRDAQGVMHITDVEEVEPVVPVPPGLLEAARTMIAEYRKEFRSEQSVRERWDGYVDGFDSTEPIDAAHLALVDAVGAAGSAPKMDIPEERSNKLDAARYRALRDNEKARAVAYRRDQYHYPIGLWSGNELDKRLDAVLGESPAPKERLHPPGTPMPQTDPVVTPPGRASEERSS